MFIGYFIINIIVLVTIVRVMPRTRLELLSCSCSVCIRKCPIYRLNRKNLMKTFDEILYECVIASVIDVIEHTQMENHYCY